MPPVDPELVSVSFDRIVALVSGIGTVLAGAIAYLFKRLMDQGEKQSALSRELGEMKGYNTGVEKLSAEVLEVVHRNTKKG